MSAVLASKTEETYELVEECLQGSVDEDVVRDIARALVRHTAEISDEAQIITKPMDRDEAMQMASSYEHVAAYVLVTLDDLVSKAPAGIEDYLAGMMVENLELESVEYEIVWAARLSLIFYVRGSVAT